MKTLEEILSAEAREMKKAKEAIDKMIAESKEAGIAWPEVKPDKIKDMTLPNSMTIVESYEDYLRRHGEFSPTDPDDFIHDVEENWMDYHWHDGELILEDENQMIYLVATIVDDIILEGVGTYIGSRLDKVEYVKILHV